jgi:hypothetical protein
VHLIALRRVDAGVERDDDALLFAAVGQILVGQPRWEEQQLPGQRLDVLAGRRRLCVGDIDDAPPNAEKGGP